MRRLPVYFLIDVSESMVGEPIKEVEKGLQTILQELRSDPYALETVFLGVLAFAGKAHVVTPLTELIEFKAPILHVGSGTNIGAGLELLMRQIDQEVQKTTSSKKGDWKPIIFLFTDGAPTSDGSAAVEKWQKSYRGKCSLVSITFGDNADVPLLEKLGDTVLTLKNADQASFREFFKWVSASLQVSSMTVNENGDDGARLAHHGIDLEKAIPSANTDENFILLSIKCSKKKDLWLAKYNAKVEAPFPLIGAYVVDEESYNALGGTGEATSTVDVATLGACAACPSCGNEGYVQCHKCGKLSCLGNEESFTCPWCGNQGKVVVMDSFDIGRNAG